MPAQKQVLFSVVRESQGPLPLDTSWQRERLTSSLRQVQLLTQKSLPHGSQLRRNRIAQWSTSTSIVQPGRGVGMGLAGSREGEL